MVHRLLPNASTVNHPSFILATAFQTFGIQHLIAVGVIVFFCVLLLWRSPEGSAATRQWLGRLLGGLLLGYAACLYVQQGITHALSWEYSLPLELCNLVLMACIVSLFWPNRFTSEIAYFWGLGGVLQATLTPDLAQGFPSWDFLFFFWGHGATLIAIVFLLSDRAFKPRRNNILRMMLALNIYALAVGAANAAIGSNYGYLCRKPSMPSLLDYLGPWPWYLLSLEVIAFLSFAILDLLWRLLVWLRSGEALAGAPGK